MEKKNRTIIPKHQEIQVRHIIPGVFIETYVGSIFYVNKEIEAKEYPTKNGHTTTVRCFELLCDNCKVPKNCLTSSIVQKKLRCNSCAKLVKSELSNEIAIGNVIKNRYNESFLIDRFIGEERIKYRVGTKYRYSRTYEVICLKCETIGIVTNSQIWNGAVTCKQCRGIKGQTNLKNITPERKLEHAQEIDNIWSEMLIMSKEGKLVEYLLDKFSLDFTDIEDKDEPKPIEPELIDEYYDGDDEIIIDDEINNMFDEYEN